MLNRCPSCQASVLDDDAEMCPLCGSPMDPAKAKGFKPAVAATGTSGTEAPKPTAAAPRASAAATPAAPMRSPAAKTKPPADDDPFAARPASSAAIPLVRKPTPQRSHKVVCPMCDTPGFAPTSASGREVRCANPKCLVPVFTAPDFAAPKPVELEPAPTTSTATIVTFAVAGLILLGGAAWWFFLRESPPAPSGPTFASDPVVPPPIGSNNPATGNPGPSTTDPAPAPAAPPPAETLAIVLDRWPALTEDITQPQRQSLLRRYGAESFALAGRADAAREQLTKLAALRGSDASYRIPPLVELAWLMLQTGDENGARSAFEETSPLTQRIAAQGFDPARIVIDWSAAAARFGQAGSALDLARSPRDDAGGEQLHAALRSAWAFSQGNLDVEHALRPVRPWSAPKAVAATLELLTRNVPDAALAVTADVSDPLTRAETLAAWAESTSLDTARPAAVRTEAIASALESADAAGQVFVLARAALRSASRGDQEAAGLLLGRAVELSSAFPPAEPFAAGSMEELYRGVIPDQGAVRLRSSALAEAAHAAARLGDSEQASSLLVQALDRLQPGAPSLTVITQRQQEFDQLGIARVRGELKSRLGLASDAQAESAANEYRRKLQDLRATADDRHAGQVALFARAIEWKLSQWAVAEAKARGAAAGATDRNAYVTGSAGGRLLGAAELARDAETADALRAAGAANRDVPGPEALELTLGPLLETGKLAEAGRQIGSETWRRVPQSDRLALAIRLACRLATQRSTSDAYAFTTALREEPLREETLRQLSAFVARNGKGAEAESLLTKLRLLPSEQAAVLRGLTEGLALIVGQSGPDTPAPAGS